MGGPYRIIRDGTYRGMKVSWEQPIQKVGDSQRRLCRQCWVHPDPNRTAIPRGRHQHIHARHARDTHLPVFRRMVACRNDQCPRFHVNTATNVDIRVPPTRRVSKAIHLSTIFRMVFGISTAVSLQSTISLVGLLVPLVDGSPELEALRRQVRPNMALK